GVARVNPRRHDDTAVTLLGAPVGDVDGYADLLVLHPAHVPSLAARLWLRYGSADGRPPAVPGRNVTGMLRAMVTGPEFAGTRGQLVKQPVGGLGGAVRRVGL